MIALAVVGTGRAGRARVRALAESAEARLAALVSRSDPDAPTFESVLADTAVAGVILCTPNLLHAPQARAALASGKHVLVEYPLAPGRDEAQELFARARGAGLVLHEEHIELLSPAQDWLRARVRELGAARRGSVHFSGASEGWIGDAALAGTPALGALARLHRLVDLFGEADVRSARLERGREPGARLRVELAFANGGVVELIEERAPGAVRGTRFAIECERGLLETPPPEPAAGLFARDLACFCARVLRGAEPYVSEARCLHALALVAAIERRLC